MSSVSSVSGNSTDLYTLLQHLNAQNASSSSTTDASAIAAQPDPSETKQTSGHHHHHHGSGVSSQIESAVTAALKNAPPGSDPNQTIQDAIASALKSGPNGQAPGANGTSGAAPGSTPDASGSSASTSQSDFEALLKSYGVDPQQFHQDFQSAVQSTQQGGSVNFATLLQSFPPGSAVDVTG